MSRVYNENKVREPEVIYLAKPGRKLLYALNGVDPNSVSLTRNLNNTDELEFEVNRYYFRDESNGYGDIDINMLLFVEDTWFKINKPPVIEIDNEREYKRVTAESQEVELMQYSLVGFRVNTGDIDSYEMQYKTDMDNTTGISDTFYTVRFYDEENPKLSLLDLILKHGNITGWKVGYIDDKTLSETSSSTGERFFLKDETSRFDVDTQDVYSFLTRDVAKAFSCIFIFDTVNKTINAYREGTLGKNTNIILGFQNLQNSLTLETDREFYTVFNVAGDDELDIGYANIGSSKITDISYFLNKKNYLSEDLIDKYNAWSDYRESRRDEYKALSIRYQELLDIKSDLEDRVPSDAVNNNWRSFEQDELIEALENYQMIIKGLEAKYVDEDNNFDFEALKKSVDYDLYIQITQYIIPEIIAVMQSKDINTVVYGFGNLFTNVNPVITYNWDSANELATVDVTEDSPCNGAIRAIKITGSGKVTQSLTGLAAAYKYVLSAYVKCTSGNGTVQLMYQHGTENAVASNPISIGNGWTRVSKEFTLGETAYTFGYIFGEGTYLLAGMQVEKDALHDFGYYAGVTSDNSLDAFESNWKLYGTVELSNKLTAYKNAIKSLTDSGFNKKPSQSEQNDWSYENRMYQKYLDYVALQDECQKALDERNAELAPIKTELTDNEDKRIKITEDVDQSNFGNVQSVFEPFTEEELCTLNELYIETDYVNENILIINTFSAAEKVDAQEKLYQTAKEQLYLESHPQYTYTDSVDNLYAIPEFREFHDDLEIGNFLYVGTDLDTFVKLRVIGLTYNPCSWDNNLTIDFSTMLTYPNKMSDFAELIDNAISSRKNQIAGTANSNDVTTYTLTADVIKALLKNPIFSGYMDGITAGSANINTITSEKVITALIKAGEGEFDKLTAETAFIKYIESTLISADKIVTTILNADKATIKELTAVLIDASQVNADLALIKDLLAGNVAAGSGQFINLTADNVKIADAVIKDIIAARISVADLLAGIITLTDQMKIVSENGKMVMDGKVLQIMGTDSKGNDYVGVQLGYDTNDIPSLILRNEDGAIVMSPSGITQDGIADGLIHTNHIGIGQVTPDRLSYKVEVDSEGNQITSIDRIYDGNGNIFGVDYTKFKESVNGSISKAEDDIVELQNMMGSITLSGQQVFMEQNNAVTPDSITITATCKQGIVPDKWFIDDVENTSYVAADKLSITIPSSFMADKLTATVKATNTEKNIYDIFTLYKIKHGEDGIAGKTTYIHIMYSDYPEPTDVSQMTTVPSDYIGIYWDFYPLNSQNPTDYEWTRFKGEEGQSIKGDPGENGRSTYFHVRYSNDGGKTFTTNNGKDAGDWMGSYTDYTETDSENPKIYTWVKTRGEQGIPGKSNFFFVRYSDYADGHDMYTTPRDSTQYMGVACIEENTAPADYQTYTWTRIRGKDGINGKDGTNSFFHIAYSVNPDGNPMTFEPTVNSKYMGNCVNTTQSSPTDYKAYTWHQIRGNDGIDGINGTTMYTWIKYADSPTTGMSDSPNGKEYIGLAFNKETPIESTDYSDYQWALMKGSDGIPGTNGKDGKTYYTWLKYADTPTSGMSDDPEGKDYMGISANRETATESTKYEDYTWIYIRGDQGIPGIDGTSNFLHIKYSNDGGKTFTANGGEELGTWIGTCVNENESDPTVVSAYVWTKFVGEDGIDGIPGTNSFLHIKYSDDGKTFTSNNGETIGCYIGTYVDEIKEDSNVFAKYTWKRFVGDDAYTVVLSNEAQPIATDINFIPLVAKSYECNVIVYKGTTLLSATSDVPTSGKYRVSVTNSAQGITVSQTTAGKIVFATGKTAISEDGVINLKIELEGTEKSATKTISYAANRTGAQGEPGISALNVILGNESQGIPCNSSQVTTQTIDIEIPFMGFKGTNRIGVIASAPSLPTGFTVIENTASTPTLTGMIKLRVASGTNLSALNKNIVIDFSLDAEKSQKIFTWFSAKPGADGQDGADGQNARLYYLDANVFAIKKSTENVFNPANITFSSYYRDGNSTTRVAYPCRFKIEEYIGDKAAVKYTSTSDESSKVYTPTATASRIVCTAMTPSGTVLDTQSVIVVADMDDIGEDLKNIHNTITQVQSTVDANTLEIKDKISKTDTYTVTDKDGNQVNKTIHDILVQSTQDISGFTNTVSNIKSEIGDKNNPADGTLYSAVTEAKQLANKFSWIVKEGSSESSMELTPNFAKIVSNRITFDGVVEILNTGVDAGVTRINGGIIETNSLDASTIKTDTLNALLVTANAIKSATYEDSTDTKSPYSKTGMWVQLDGTGAIKSRNFAIDKDGNAYFKGEIHALTGELGSLTVTGILTGGTIIGSKIQSTSYVAGSGGSYNKTSTGMIVDLDKGYIATPYLYTDSNGKLHATGGDFEGNITAKGGNIGGFTINDNCIFNGTASITSTTKGVYIGTDGINMGGNCKITSSGKLTAVGADITGAITATSLRLTGNVTGLSFYDLTDRPYIPDVTKYIQKDGTIGDEPSEGATGFTVSSSGLLQASNAIIYGTIYASNGKFAGEVDAKEMKAQKAYYIYYDNKNYYKPIIKANDFSNTTKSIMIGTNLEANDYSIQIYSSTSGGTVHIFDDDISIAGTDALRLAGGVINFASNNPVTINGQSISVEGHYHTSLSYNNSARVQVFTSGGNYGFAPTTDGQYPCGGASSKWKAVWSANGTIQTSDRNDKTSITLLDKRHENMFMELQPVTYMFKDMYENDNHDRIHCGLIAQNVYEAAKKHGLSPETFAAICKDDLDSPLPDGRTERWALNYGELHGLEIHMIQKAVRTIAELEKRIIFLESQI